LFTRENSDLKLSAADLRGGTRIRNLKTNMVSARTQYLAMSILFPSDFLSFLIRVNPRSSAANNQTLKEHIP